MTDVTLDKTSARMAASVKVEIDMPGEDDAGKLRSATVKFSGGKANLRCTEKYDASSGTPLRTKMGCMARPPRLVGLASMKVSSDP